MHKYITALSAAALLLIPTGFLYGDIIITKDGMTLNGKIINAGKDRIIFSNYHGTFTIDRFQIKEIHKTDSFKEDARIIEKSGKKVDEDEIKMNYEAGVEKLRENIPDNKDKDGKIKTPTSNFTLYISPFFDSNLSTLGSVLPYSFGGYAIADIPLNDSLVPQQIHLAGMRSEISYLYSENGGKKVSGPRVSLGPLWNYHMSFLNQEFEWNISPLIGLGWYTIKGRTQQASAIKWNAAVISGPVFIIRSVLIYPHIRFDYIYDGYEPLAGVGFGLGIGYRFNTESRNK